MSATPETIAIRAIDYLLESDFCADLECELAFRPETFSPREKEMAELIGKLYRLAHGADRKSSCYYVHADWRREAQELLTFMERQP